MDDANKKEIHRKCVFKEITRSNIYIYIYMYTYNIIDSFVIRPKIQIRGKTLRFSGIQQSQETLNAAAKQ